MLAESMWRKFDAAAQANSPRLPLRSDPSSARPIGGCTDLRQRYWNTLPLNQHTRLRLLLPPAHGQHFYPIIGQMSGRLGFVHGDATQAKLDKLGSAVGATSTTGVWLLLRSAVPRKMEVAGAPREEVNNTPSR